MIDIDGSYGEGGGQLVRSAVALAAITCIPIRVVNVRARREKPGLAPQHLAAVRAVAQVCGAKTEGLELRATAFTFTPGLLDGGTFRFDIGTAGSITLVLQALLPPLLAAGSSAHVCIIGGTDVRQAPPIDYLIQVMGHHLARMGARLRFIVSRRGYYPRGGGEVEVGVSPAALQPLQLPAPGTLQRVEGLAHVSNLPASIAERMRNAALARLAGLPHVPQGANIATRVFSGEEAIGQGGAVIAWAQTEHSVLAAARVAERGVCAETLGDAVGRELHADIGAGATVDVHAADQLPLYLVLARGTSSFATRELTSHAHTAIWLIQRFLPVRITSDQHGALTRVRIET